MLPLRAFARAATQRSPLTRASSTASPPSLSAWRASVNSTRTTQRDNVDLARVQGLVSTIELPQDGPAESWSQGSPLPPGYSLLLFPPVHSTLSSLNADGTEPAGPFHPPSPPPPAAGLERMWVSGGWEFSSAGLKVGDDVVSVGQVEDVKERTGRDGRRGIYVTVRREIGREGEAVSLVERRTHLYRPPLVGSVAAVPGVKAQTTARKDEADFTLPFRTTPPMLFRFSALTFNTHRIHWDIRYCLDVEKRAGLIVHGPMTSLLLLSALRHNLPPGLDESAIKSFTYRATSPLVVGTDVWFCGRWTDNGKGCDMWLEDAEGRVYMTGRGVLE